MRFSEYLEQRKTDDNPGKVDNLEERDISLELKEAQINLKRIEDMLNQQEYGKIPELIYKISSSIEEARIEFKKAVND